MLIDSFLHQFLFVCLAGVGNCPSSEREAAAPPVPKYFQGVLASDLAHFYVYHALK